MRTWFRTVNQYLKRTTRPWENSPMRPGAESPSMIPTRRMKAFQNRGEGLRAIMNFFLTYIFSTIYIFLNVHRIKKNSSLQFFFSWKNKFNIFQISKSINFLVKMKITLFFILNIFELFEGGRGGWLAYHQVGKSKVICYFHVA